MALQIASIDQPNRFGLLGVDFRLAVRAFAVAQRPVIVKRNFSLEHGLFIAQVNIFPNGLALRLGEAAEQRNEELTGLRQGVDVFLLGVNKYSNIYQ